MFIFVAVFCYKYRKFVAGNTDSKIEFLLFFWCFLLRHTSQSVCFDVLGQKSIKFAYWKLEKTSVLLQIIAVFNWCITQHPPDIRINSCPSMNIYFDVLECKPNALCATDAVVLPDLILFGFDLKWHKNLF